MAFRFSSELVANLTIALSSTREMEAGHGAAGSAICRKGCSSKYSMVTAVAISDAETSNPAG
jgi:hypothetical protein